MNNFQRIKQMTVEEMVVFLQEIADSYWLKKDIEQWLLQEVENE